MGKEVKPQGGSKMTKKVLVIISGLALLFTACSKENLPVTANYWPLAEGNQWTTEEDFSWDIQLTGPGASTSTTEHSVAAFKESSAGKLMWPYTYTTTSPGVDPFTNTEYYYVTADSVYVYDSLGAEEPRMVEPNILSVGMEWDAMLSLPISISGIPLSNLPAHFKVVASEVVAVPAGSFTCFKIVVDIDLQGVYVESALTEWRAANIGRVKMVTDIETSLAVLGTADIEGTSELTKKNW